MVNDPVALTVPGDRRSLVHAFLQHGHAAFPVLKEGTRKLVGVVGRRDLLENPDEHQLSLLMDPNPATTYPEATLHEAARILVRHRLRLLPVVNAVNDLLGVITPAELLAALPRRPDHLAQHLTRRLVPLHRLTPTPVALEILRTTGATAAPVLDDHGLYAGLLTEAELVRHLRLSDDVVTTVEGSAPEGDAWTWDRIHQTSSVRHAASRLEAPPVPAEALMLRDVPTGTPHMPLWAAVDAVAANRVHHLPVVDAEGRIVDVLTELDLLAALLA